MNCKIVLALTAVCASAALSSPTFENNVTRARHPCLCKKIYAPVCGSDSKTYGSECALNCHNFKEGTSVTVASQGQCKIEQCACTLKYDPVCANDGKTYGNICFMLCQSNLDIEVVNKGVCPDEVEGSKPTLTIPCNCHEELHELCGTDGETYGNLCMLECYKNNWYPKLEIAYNGECDDSDKATEK